MTTLGAEIAAAVRYLRDAGIAGAAVDARVLAAFVFGLPREAIATRPELTPDPDALTRYRALIARRGAGEPVAHLTGMREFWGRAFRVSPAVLIPRPETEGLIEAALMAFPDADAPLRVLDIGAGSGALLLTLLCEFPNATGIGTDLSCEALRVAATNADALNVAMRARFVEGSWFAGQAGPFDLIVSNPPYIPHADIQTLDRDVRAFDPLLALDGGADGLAAYRALAPSLAGALQGDGLALVEIGIRQADAVSEILRGAGLAVLPPIPDLAGIPRVLAAAPPGAKAFLTLKKRLECGARIANDRAGQ